jgi:threonine dehydrogenase-like Zn-dependent dehydrogenase
VEGLRPGDRVLTRHRHASHALVDLTPGVYSETARQPALPEVQLQRLPTGVADDHAAFAVLASVALHGVRKAALQLGESAAVVGQGVVGQLVGQFARLSGALPLIAVDRVASRLERARVGGAHATVDASREDVGEAVRALTGGAGVDAGFEATRTPGAFPELLGLMAVGGRVVMVGSVHERASLHLFDDLQRQEVTIIGAWHPRAPVAPHHYAPWSQARNRAVYLDLLRTGLVRVDDLITHRARPEEAPRLYTELAAAPGDWLGVLFVWD